MRSPAPAHPAPLPDVGATLVETRVEEQSSQEEPDAVQSVTVEQDVVTDEATGALQRRSCREILFSVILQVRQWKGFK